MRLKTLSKLRVSEVLFPLSKMLKPKRLKVSNVKKSYGL